jgi:hypothetical protein
MTESSAGQGESVLGFLMAASALEDGNLKN